MYTHYTSVFPLAAQLLWALVVHREQARALLVANVAAVIGFAPWLPVLSKNAGSFGTKVFEIFDPFGLHAVVHDVSRWAIGHPYLRLSTEPGPVAIVLILGGFGLAAGLAARLVASARAAGRERFVLNVAPILLPVLLALATPVGLALYSTVRDSAWDLRNLISSWPGFGLTLGALLTMSRHRLGIAATGLVVVGFAIGAVQLLSSANERPDYAAAASLVLSRHERADPVAIIEAPTPGPYSAMDAAFDYDGDPGRPLLRVGSSSLGATLAAPPYAFLPPTPTATLAAATARSRAHEVFIVAPGIATVAQILRSAALDVPRVLGPAFGTGASGALLGTVFKPLSVYMRDILPRYMPVETIHLPGFLRLSVYVFRRR
jgi:hypothetical protein